MVSSNLPKHGEEIIVSQQNALGGQKLVANFQFQRFLDEIGELVNENNSSTIVEQVDNISTQQEVNRAAIGAQRKLINDALSQLAILSAEDAKLRSLINNKDSDILDAVEDNSQLIQVLSGSLSQLSAQFGLAEKTINDLLTLVSVLGAENVQLAAELQATRKQLADVEQLIYVS